MLDNQNTSLTPFQHWVLQAARNVGAAASVDPDPLGLEFEAVGNIHHRFATTRTSPVWSRTRRAGR